MRGIERRIEELEEKVGLRDVITPVIELAFVWANVKTESVLILSPDGEGWKERTKASDIV